MSSVSDHDEPTPSDPVSAGIEHLQRAAQEALAAARAMIDAAEKVIADPAALEAVMATVTAVARSATESVANIANAAGRARRNEPGDDDGDGFEHIRVG